MYHAGKSGCINSSEQFAGANGPDSPNSSQGKVKQAASQTVKRGSYGQTGIIRSGGDHTVRRGGLNGSNLKVRRGGSERSNQMVRRDGPDK